MANISAKEYQSRLQSIISNPSFFNNELVKLIEQDKGRFLFEEKKNEFQFGYRPNGKKIGKYQSESYAFDKHNQNALAGYGYVDLFKTGAFVNSLFVVRGGKNGVLFDASNNKKDLLGKKYGYDIYDISRRSLLEYGQNYIRLDIVKIFKNKYKIG